MADDRDLMLFNTSFPEDNKEEDCTGRKAIVSNGLKCKRLGIRIF